MLLPRGDDGRMRDPGAVQRRESEESFRTAFPSGPVGRRLLPPHQEERPVPVPERERVWAQMLSPTGYAGLCGSLPA